MQDSHGHNGAGEVYGFIPTGRNWGMIRYNGRLWEKSEEITIMFDTMQFDRERWMQNGGLRNPSGAS